MDRSLNSRKRKHFLLMCLLGSLTGCVANPVQVPTMWDRLGVTGATARLRDATINRNGNFPGLEKKPPVLRIADPANLAEGKPEVIKTAAKIKQDQDLKKQKLKAIKFLGEVGCGCYNKDDQVAKALLEALGDCDPEVKKAAIEAISKNATACKKCSNGCAVTCCTADVVKKLEEMAVGIDEKGCPKEPDKEIRAAAMCALKLCGCAPETPPEEIPAPPEVEEVSPPSVEGDIETPREVKPNIETPSAALPSTQKFEEGSVAKVSFSGSSTPKSEPQDRSVDEARLQTSTHGKPSSDQYGVGTEPVRLAKRKSKDGEFISGIANAEQLVQAKVASVGAKRCTMEIEMPQAYDLAENQQLILVDRVGNIQVGSIASVQGNRIAVNFEETSVLATSKGEQVRIGLLNR